MIESESSLHRCYGCHARFTHQPELEYYRFAAIGRYGIAIPECVAAYLEIIAKESELFGYPPAHRLIVDAYAVQHPRRKEWQAKLKIEPRLISASIQSVACHLIALHLALEKQVPLLKIAGNMDHFLAVMTAQGVEFTELSPPENLGAFTVQTMKEVVTSEALNLEKYHQAALDWAKNAWDAWEAHHVTIRQWCKKYNGDT